MALPISLSYVNILNHIIATPTSRQLTLQKGGAKKQFTFKKMLTVQQKPDKATTTQRTQRHTVRQTDTKRQLAKNEETVRKERKG